MFNWLLRHLFLIGLPSATIDACISHAEVRQLLRFRFAYMFSFYAPVLIPLLELLNGRMDPAMGVLSLGVASLAMVLADVPTGLYADRIGTKAALRLGLQMACVIMVGFFALGLWRAWAVASGRMTGQWLPGIAGMLVLESAIGVSLALLSGPDTVLFLAVARRSGLPQLDRTGFEGVGSAIRYLGTMTAVGIGTAIYELIEVLVRLPALRIGLQYSLFLLTLLAQVVALNSLSLILDLDSESAGNSTSRKRPGFYDVARSLYEVSRWPRFLAQMWLLCLVSASAMFSIYLLQSPLSRLASDLARQSPMWLLLYTSVSMLGYWACSRGSHRIRHYHPVQEQTIMKGRFPALLAGASLVLLSIYPVVYTLFRGTSPSYQKAALALTAGAIGFLFNYLRGLTDPYSAIALITFIAERGHTVPVAVVSGFNSIKRGIHFGLSALFYFIQRIHGAAYSNPDALLSITLGWLVVGFAFSALPALFWWFRAEKLSSSDGTLK